MNQEAPEATDAVGSPTPLPRVDCLRIGDDPHLAANGCAGCQARYFDRRNACARCGKEEFRSVRVADDATLRSSASSTGLHPAFRCRTCRRSC